MLNKILDSFKVTGLNGGSPVYNTKKMGSQSFSSSGRYFFHSSHIIDTFVSPFLLLDYYIARFPSLTSVLQQPIDFTGGITGHFIDEPALIDYH
jgi:hypothetical protein